MMGTSYRTFLLTLFIVCSGSLLNQLRAQGTNCDQLVWADEFDANGAPSSARWNYDLGGGGWGNNELQTYTDNLINSWVENGKLYIKALKTNNSWSSARLVSRQKGDWLYGRIEVKAKLPSGKGTWPAIWMLPTDWAYGNWPSSGELDIMEHVGYDQGRIYGTVHTDVYNGSLGTQKGGNIFIQDASTNFHVYVIEWDEEKINWFVDDQLYFTFNNEHKTYKEWPFDKRFHLLLNIAIGGTWGGAQGIDPNLTEATMEIDYVRVYSSKMATPVISGSTLNSNGQQYEYQTDAVADVKYLWHLPDGVIAVSGENTNKIAVQWNDAPGDIQLEMQSACDTVFSDVFHVDYQIKPVGQFDILPRNSSQQLNWSAVPGQTNSLSLDTEGNDLLVGFQIVSPTQNAYISYDFGGVIDLSSLSKLCFDLKIDPANPPSNMRIDLVDRNGNVNMSNLFKIDQMPTDDQFHTYSHIFTNPGDGSFLLDQITQIRIYLNYGVFGQTGSGVFSLGNVVLKDPNATGFSNLEAEKPLHLYPNPTANNLTIESTEEIISVEVFNLNGQKLLSKSGRMGKQYKLQLEGIQPGIYFVKVNGKHTGKIVVHD